MLVILRTKSCAGRAAVLGLTLAASIAPGLRAQIITSPLPGLRAEVATFIVQGVNGGSLPLAVMPQTQSRKENGALVRVVVEIPGLELTSKDWATDEDASLELELFLYAVDSSGAVVGHRAERVTAPVDRWGELVSSGGVRWAPEVELTAGETSLRVLVRQPSSGRFGMQVVEWDVPNAADLAESDRDAPLAVTSCPVWLELLRTSEPLAEPRSGRPVWTVGEEASIRIPFAGLPNENAATEEGKSELRFESASGAVTIFEFELEVARGEELQHPVVNFRVPELPLGAYRLSTLDGPTQRVSRPLEVWILNRTTEQDNLGSREECSWPVVLQEIRAAQATTDPAEITEGSKPGLRQAVRQKYRQVLSDLAAGTPPAEAAKLLADAEIDALGDHLEDIPELLLGELAEARALGEIDAETFVPLFRIHLQAYREHYRRRQFPFASHSRRVAVAIADSWLETASTTEAKERVAECLLGLAVTADRHRMFSVSESLLERAATLDPSNPTGRLLLSVLYEKLGEYEAAHQQLEGLVEGSPAHAEAWLRLGVMRSRLGDERGARSALHRVIQLRPIEWAHSLAYQVLARMDFSKDRFREGVHQLKEGRLLIPDDELIRLALAYGLERLGELGPARDLLMAPATPSPMHGSSARFRYTESAEIAARRLERRLDRNATVRQPSLSRALERLADGTR